MRRRTTRSSTRLCVVHVPSVLTVVIYSPAMAIFLNDYHKQRVERQAAIDSARPARSPKELAELQKRVLAQMARDKAAQQKRER